MKKLFITLLLSLVAFQVAATTLNFNSQSYDTDDLEGYGFFEEVTSGTGVTVDRWLAIYLDALADAGKNMVTTSTSSVSIGTGTKNFTMASAIPYAVGAYVIAADTAAPTTNYMIGQVTARSGTALTISVPTGGNFGSGTLSSWAISVSGPIGATGAAGAGSGDMLESTYDPAAISEQLVGLTATQTLSNKTLTAPVLNGSLSGTGFKDEDNMSSDSATAVASQQSIKAYVDSQAFVAPHLGFVSGDYYSMLGASGTATNFAINANRMYLVPFYVPETATFDRIGIYVSSTAAASVRLGIYENSSGVAGDLVVDAGTVSTASSGLQTATISQSLTQGVYWLAAISNGTPGLLRYDTTTTGIYGAVNTGDLAPKISCQDVTYGALPDPAVVNLTACDSLGIVLRKQ